MVALFGASGGVGSQLMNIALEKEDTVYAYVRNPDKISLRHENLHIIYGGLEDVSLMEEVISKADVVFSALGPEMRADKKDVSTPVADGSEHILDIMRKYGKNRFICIATPTLKAQEDPDGGFGKFLRKYLVPLSVPPAFREITKLGEVVKTSPLDWSVVRFLNPTAKTDERAYKFAVGNEKYKMSVSRYNISAGIYEIAKNSTYLRKMPIIFNI